MTTTNTLADSLRNAVSSMPAKVSKAKTCSVVKVDGRTVGYLVFGARTVRVDVPESGKLVRYRIKTAKDVKIAVAAMKRRMPKTTKRAKAPIKRVAAPLS